MCVTLGFAGHLDWPDVFWRAPVGWFDLETGSALDVKRAQ
jgi:hypothetical protein